MSLGDSGFPVPSTLLGDFATCVFAETSTASNTTILSPKVFNIPTVIPISARLPPYFKTHGVVASRLSLYDRYNFSTVMLCKLCQLGKKETAKIKGLKELHTDRLTFYPHKIGLLEISAGVISSSEDSDNDRCRACFEVRLDA